MFGWGLMAIGSPVASLFVEFGSDTKGFDKGVNEVESGLGKVKSGIGNVITTAAGFAVATAGIAGVGAAISGVVGNTVGFDTAMRELNVLAKMGADEYDAFSNKVLDVSSNLGVDATASVQALTTAIGSGVPKENLISFIENSTKAAIGGSADLGMVVAGTTGIVKAYGMSWDDVNKVQDTFLQIADDGVTTVEELSKQMGGVAPIANAAGVSFEEMSAVYSTLTGVTGNTSEVTTQLKGALTAVIKPSAEATKMASQMGIDFSTTALKSKGLAGFLQEVGTKADAFAKESGMSTVDVLGKLFGSVEGLNGVLALTGSQADAFGENLGNIENASGNVDKAFAEMNKSFGRMISSARAKLQAFGIKLGMWLLPILFSLGAKVQELASSIFPHLMRVWSALQGPIALVRDGILTFIQALSGDWTDAEGIHPLHRAIGNVALLIRETVIPAFFAVRDAVVNFVTFALPYIQRFADWFLTVGLPAIIGFATEAQRIYRDVLLTAITGFVDFVLPYLMTFANWFTGVALPAIIKFANQAQELFLNVILPAVQTFITTVLPHLISFFNTLVSYIPTAQQLGAMLTQAFTSIGETVATVFAVVAPILVAVFDSIMVAATTIIPQLVGIWETLSGQWSASTPLIESLKNLFDQLKPALIAIGIVIGTVLVVAVGILMGVLGGLAGFLNGALPGAIKAVTGVINVVSGVLQVFSSLIIGIVNVVSALLHGEWGEAWNAAKEMVSGMADGVIQILTGLWQVVSGIIGGLVSGVIGLISGFIDSFIGFFQNLYDVLVGNSIVPDLVADIISTISGLPGAVIGFISGMVTDAITHFTTLATDTIAKAVEIATEVPAKISDMATTALTNMGTFVTDMLTKAGEVVTNVVTEVTKLVTEVPGKITDMGTTAVTEFATFVTNAVAEVASLPGKALEALSGIGSTLLSAGSDLIGGFIQGIKDKIPDVQGALGGLTDKLTSWKGPPTKDRVILKPSGQMVIDGFRAGLESRYPAVHDSLGTFTKDIVASVASAEGAAQAAGKSIGVAISRGIQEGLSSGTSGAGGASGVLQTITGGAGAVSGIKDIQGIVAQTYRAQDSTPTFKEYDAWRNKQVENGLLTSSGKTTAAFYDTYYPGKFPDSMRLAAGGITSGPMLAMIGDNPGGREAVIPLDKLPGMVDRINERFARANDSAQDIGVTVYVHNTYQLDGRELSRAVAKQVAQEVRTQGGTLPRR